MAERVEGGGRDYRLRGSGPVDKKYLGRLYAFRDKIKRESRKKGGKS